jgi:hypothetical protein
MINRISVTTYFSYAISLRRPPEYPIPLLPLLDCLASTYRSDFRVKIKVISPMHRRPDRHNVSLINPQQNFFGCAIFRYRHLSTSIAYFSRTHLAFAPPSRPMFRPPARRCAAGAIFSSVVRPTYNQRRHPFPCRIAQNQTVHHTPDGLPKSSVESDLLLKGIPGVNTTQFIPDV